MKKKLFTPKVPKPYSPEEALAYLMDCNLSKNQYITTHIGAKERNANIYPAYAKLVAAKKDCYPQNIEYSEVKSRVPLQDLVNHTSARIFKLMKFKNIQYEDGQYELIHKWGMDGTSNQARYRQKFQCQVPIDNESDPDDPGDPTPTSSRSTSTYSETTYAQILWNLNFQFLFTLCYSNVLCLLQNDGGFTCPAGVTCHQKWRKKIGLEK